MDRSYLNINSSKSIASPRRRLSLAQSLKKAGSGMSLSGRSNQSVQIICRTSNHIVEHFGSALPVLVTEALTFVDRNAVVSVSISQDGWAWLVCARRLLIWQFKITVHDSKQRRTFKSQCRELLLPQSDLAHKAECIAVWLTSGQQAPSCIAVSPEGLVRYWASIANEESYVEISAELAGQEVDHLTYLPGYGCILATTTCTVALLQIQVVAGRSNIVCRVLKTSKGWLGGIGRRVSSLIFGSTPLSPALEPKLVKVVCTESNEKGSRILILAGTCLQYWHFPYGEQEKMEFDEDISEMVSQSFQRHFWESNACSTRNIYTWLIDMQPSEDGIVILMAAHCPDLSSQIQFSLGSIVLSGALLPSSFKWFLPVNIGPLYFNEQIDSALMSYRFILSGWEIIVFNEQTVLVISNLSEYEQDKIDITQGEEDSILGGSLCSGTPVLFTKSHGLVTINSSDFSNQDFNTTYSDVNLSLECGNNTRLVPESFPTSHTTENFNDLYYSTDDSARLKAAFVLSSQQSKVLCEEILTNLFPVQEEPVMDIDAFLDTLVLKVAKDLIDDYPANDPRWANCRDLSTSLNTVVAIQTPNQLEGKQKTLDLFLTFLMEQNLWSRFCAVTYRGVVMSTCHVLGEFAEKIVAMLTIYNLQQKYPSYIDASIKKTVYPDNIATSDLSYSDIFFRKVSQVHHFFPNLIDNLLEESRVEQPYKQAAEHIYQVNYIILTILQEVVQYRQVNACKFTPPRNSPVMEYLPWTAASGDQGLKNCLSTMQNLTLKNGITSTNDITLKNKLHEQLVQIIDLILNGRKCHLDSLKKSEKFKTFHKQYESERTGLIQLIINANEYESAAMLAEKYCDFASLIQICEITNNRTRLDSYMKKFSDKDFAGFLFTWYVKNGRQGQLLERCRHLGDSELIEKLLDHPSLSWIQAALVGNFVNSSDTLYLLGIQEQEFVTRKKSMLSLAKLALLACDDYKENVQNMKRIDDELMLVAHQEDVPGHVLELYGYNIEKLRVLSPKELINLYTCLESPISNEYDYKKSLDLIDYIGEDEERASLKLKIWARAAKCDMEKWEAVGKNPKKHVQETTFFKLMDLVHVMGHKIEEVLPPIEMLLMEPELGNLAENSNFQYLLKLVYEYAYENY